jgi:predicted nuclease of predicted toxin-antitoxin system
MSVRVKIDEDLPKEIAEVLRYAGHDALTVVEQQMTGTTDIDLMRAVMNEQRCLVKADKGFADARKHPPDSHFGIILLRLPRESRAGYLRLVQSLLVSRPLESLSGSITVVTPDGIRVHRG